MYEVKTDLSRTKEGFVDGRLHRIDGPAIEWSDGTREWFVNGKRHRTDGPAIEWMNGTKEWFVNGVFIRSEKK